MKVLIVEDEKAAARRLEKMVLAIEPGAEMLGPLDSVAETIHWLNTNAPPDLVLLDIHLADGSSFEIFEQLTIDFPIIFTTAYDEYAIRAFRVSAIDYLLKPVKKEELKDALEKVKQHKIQETLDYQELLKAITTTHQDRRYLVKIGRQIKMIDTKEIAYVYTENKITFIVTLTGKRHPIDYSLERMEEMLPATQYFRINRQYIIGIHAIKEMIAYSKSRVKLILHQAYDRKDDLVVSTERSPYFKRWLKGES